MPLKKSAATLVLVFALIATLMATAIAAQSPPEGEPEMRDSIKMEVTILGDETVFHVRLCNLSSEEDLLVFSNVEIDRNGQTGGVARITLCFIDTKADRGPYDLFLVADDFVSTTTPGTTIGAEHVAVTTIYNPSSIFLVSADGRIYGRIGTTRINPTIAGSELDLPHEVPNPQGLNNPVIVSEVTAGPGSVQSQMDMLLTFSPEHDGPRGTFTSTLYLDVYAGDTP